MWKEFYSAAQEAGPPRWLWDCGLSSYFCIQGRMPVGWPGTSALASGSAPLPCQQLPRFSTVIPGEWAEPSPRSCIFKKNTHLFIFWLWWVFGPWGPFFSCKCVGPGFQLLTWAGFLTVEASCCRAGFRAQAPAGGCGLAQELGFWVYGYCGSIVRCTGLVVLWRADLGTSDPSHVSQYWQVEVIENKLPYQIWERDEYIELRSQEQLTWRLLEPETVRNINVLGQASSHTNGS